MHCLSHEGNTYEEHNGYVVFKGYINGSAREYGGAEGEGGSRYSAHCRTTAIGLLFYLLSDYRNRGSVSYRKDWRVLETLGLSDQGLSFSDNQISDTQKAIGCTLTALQKSFASNACLPQSALKIESPSSIVGFSKLFSKQEKYLKGLP